MALRRAIFLDKDGTLIESVPCDVERTRIRLAQDAVSALRALSDEGFRVAVVSNQPGVAFGLFPFGGLAAVEEHLRDLFLARDLELDGCYWCPHHPEGSVAEYAVECACRKPMPGLFHRAAGELGIDLARSWVVGGDLDDMEAGRRAGCRTVFLDAGKETPGRGSPLREPDLTAPDLLRAAHGILRVERRRGWRVENRA